MSPIRVTQWGDKSAYGHRNAARATSQAIQSKRAGTAFVLVTVLLDTLGLGLVVPVGPRLVASFLNGDLGAAARYFGLLTSLYAVMQFVCAPLVGGLSDRFGRRPVILAAVLGAAISYFISALAPTVGWLFLGRTIAGMTGASFAAATAYVADVTTPEKRAQGFGMIGAVFGLGFILGPALGGLLGDAGLRVPYFVGGALNVVNFLYGAFVLPESLGVEKRRPFSIARANPLGALRSIGRHPIVLGLTGTILLSFVAQWILQSVWALYTQARYDWSLRQVGLSLMVMGLATAVIQGGVVRAVVPRLGEPRALVVGLAAVVMGQMALGLATHGWMTYVFILLLSVGGLAGPAAQAIISRETGESEQGELQGTINSLGGLAAIAGPLVGTSLLARFGTEVSRPYVPGAPFFAAAAFVALGLLLALRQLAVLDAERRSAPRAETGTA